MEDDIDIYADLPAFGPKQDSDKNVRIIDDNRLR